MSSDQDSVQNGTTLLLRILVAGTCLLGGSLALDHLIAEQLKGRASPAQLAEAGASGLRAPQMMAALPAIATAAKATPSTVVVGSSTSMFGFKPRAFDEAALSHGVQTESYNLGVVMAPPSLVLGIVSGLRRELIQNDAKLKTSILVFTPYQTTKPMWQREARVHTRMMTQYASIYRSDDVPMLAKIRPELAVDVELLVADRTPLPGISSLAYQMAFPTPRWWSTPPRPSTPVERAQSTIRQAMAGSWQLPLRGEVARDAATETAMKLINNDAFERDFDAAELRLSESEVAAFIESIRQARTVSNQVVVALTPQRRASWPTAAGTARLKEVLTRIHDETGVSIVDMYQSEKFSDADFVDSHHLNEAGSRKWSAMLADAIGNSPR
jgi:hypothetical protein